MHPYKGIFYLDQLLPEALVISLFSVLYVQRPILFCNKTP